jgi:hypothetical protein
MNAADPMVATDSVRYRAVWRRQCHAHNRNGERCGRWACPWMAVCRIHGGASPQAIAKADERRATVLMHLYGITPALIERIHRIVLDPTSRPRDVVAIAKLVLDLLLPLHHEPRSSYGPMHTEIEELGMVVGE